MKLRTKSLLATIGLCPAFARCNNFSRLGVNTVFLIAVLICATEAAAQAACSPPDTDVPVNVRSCGNPEFQSCSLDVDGIARHFCLHIPKQPKENIPLVLGFHGGGGMASRAVNWLDKHTEQGMILVAPTALPTPAGSSNSQDIEFINMLIEELDNRFNVEQRFAVGFSSGAGMVLQLMITDPMASAIDGFAMVANGINDSKANAVSTGGGVGDFSAVSHETRSPAMLIWGTGDKTHLPSARLAARADELAAAGATNCAAVLDTPSKTFGCLMSNPMADTLEKHTFISRIEETQDWLVKFNGARKRAIEGLYPDLGHGQTNGPEDKTMTVRRDFLSGANGQAVAVLTVIDGGHVFPGATGNEPPCSSTSCDIDAMEEVLHFWRANAGLNNIWQ